MSRNSKANMILKQEMKRQPALKKDPVISELAALADNVVSTHMRYQLALDKRGAAVAALWGQYSARDIADVLGISRQKVYDIYTRHQITHRGHSPKEDYAP